MEIKPNREILSFLEDQGLCEHSTAQLYCDIIDGYLSGQIGEKQLWSDLGGRGRAASTITRALGKCPTCKVMAKPKPRYVITEAYDIEVEG